MADKKAPTQRTPKGHEIPVTKRGEFLRNLKKAAKAKSSTADSAKK